MQRTIGIDLGTTNSVLAYVTKGEPRILLDRTNQDLTPSVVGADKRQGYVVGLRAKARGASEPWNTITSIKRFMGRKFKDPAVQRAIAHVGYRVTEGPDGDVQVWFKERPYSPTEISSLILRHLKEEAEARLGGAVTRAVITVPAYFGERQVAATKAAGELAGFHVVKIINEPTAAALAFGVIQGDNEDGKTFLVYDLGGGTFDISIMMPVEGTFTVLGTEGDNFLGGDDFDQRIEQYILREIKQQRSLDLSSRFDEPARSARHTIRGQAESAKINLSAQPIADIELIAIHPDIDDLWLELGRDKFEAMIREQLNKTIALTRKAIHEAHLTPEDIDYILLVGGSTAIPLVTELLKEAFGDIRIRKDINPMQCVALGAAVQSALVTEIQCDRCHTENSVYVDSCKECGTPLLPPEKVSCPTCYMLVDVGETSCWKCGERVGQNAPSPALVSTHRCTSCGDILPKGQSCRRCTPVEEPPMGLKCSNCETVNAIGASSCINCQQPMAVSTVMDVTPKNLGIELVDGTFSVIVPKGTYYPMPVLEPKTYYTSIPGQRRLEVPVFEGSEAVAAANDKVGVITLVLPESLPQRTPVEVAIGVDKNRTLTVVVRVLSSDMPAKEATIQRSSSLSAEQRQEIEKAREEVFAFVDQWQRELTDAEKSALHTLVDRLDQTLNLARSQALAPVLEDARTLLSLASEIRGTDAYASNMLFYVGEYMPQERVNEMEHLLGELEDARQRADWRNAQSVCKKIDDVLSHLGNAYHMINQMKAAARHGRLSPSLTHRIESALFNLEKGLDTANGERTNQGMSMLAALGDEYFEEMSRLATQSQEVTKLRD